MCLVQYLQAEARPDQPILSCDDYMLKEDCDYKKENEEDDRDIMPVL